MVSLIVKSEELGFLRGVWCEMLQLGCKYRSFWDCLGWIDPLCVLVE